MSRFGTTEFYLEVAKGNVAGHSIVNKFGANPDVATGPEDVWTHSGLYAASGGYLTVATTVKAVAVGGSEDTLTTGIGAWTVRIYGLDETWAEANEAVNMAGTTGSAPTTTTFIRVFRVVVETAGTHGTNYREIDIVDNATGLIVLADVFTSATFAGDGQTQMAVYTVPLAKTAYFLKGYVAVAGTDKTAEIAQFQWKARPNSIANGAWATKGEMSCITLGNNWWQYEYGAPAGQIPEKTDIRIECVATSKALSVVAGFDLLLVDN